MASANHQSDVMDALRDIQKSQSTLLAAISSLSSSALKSSGTSVSASSVARLQSDYEPESVNGPIAEEPIEEDTSIDPATTLQAPAPSSPSQRPAFTSRIILTFVTPSTVARRRLTRAFSTYPKQIGINPLPMDWGNPEPQQRGPIVVSRAPSTIRRRNGS